MGLKEVLKKISVFSTHSLPCKSYSENIPEDTHIKLLEEKPRDGTNKQLATNAGDSHEHSTENNLQIEGGVNIDEVICELAPSIVTLAAKASKSIYLMLRLLVDSIILMFM